MKSKKARAEARRQRSLAINRLREMGMTDAEIEAELGFSISGDESANHDVSNDSADDAEQVDKQQDSAGSDDTGEIVDAEIVDLEDEPSSDGPMRRGENGPAHLPAVISQPTGNENRSEQRAFSQYSDEWWQHAKPTVRQRRCKAHRKDGGQCRQPAINGATVCRFHGGAAKHVKQAARARLENAADRMAKELLRMAIDDDISDSVKLAAIKDALDRGGLKPTEQVVLSAGVQTGYEEIFDDISTTTRAESRRVRGIEDDDTESIDYQGDSHPHPAMWADPTNHADYQQDSNGGDEYRDIQRRESDSSGPASSQSDDVGDRDGSHRPRSGRRAAGQSGPHITGEDAIRIANRANFATGALKALPPGRSG